MALIPPLRVRGWRDAGPGRESSTARMYGRRSQILFGPAAHERQSGRPRAVAASGSSSIARPSRGEPSGQKISISFDTIFVRSPFRARCSSSSRTSKDEAPHVLYVYGQPWWRVPVQPPQGGQACKRTIEGQWMALLVVVTECHHEPHQRTGSPIAQPNSSRSGTPAEFRTPGCPARRRRGVGQDQECAGGVDGGRGRACRSQSSPRLQALCQPRRALGGRVPPGSVEVAHRARIGSGFRKHCRGDVPSPPARFDPGHGGARERSSAPFVPPAVGTEASAENNGRGTTTRSGPSPPWQFGSTGLSAVALPLSPPYCWARSMPFWRSGVAIRANAVQRPSRRPTWRWSSAPIRERPRTVGPWQPRANDLHPRRATTSDHSKSGSGRRVPQSFRTRPVRDPPLGLHPSPHRLPPRHREQQLLPHEHWDDRQDRPSERSHGPREQGRLRVNLLEAAHRFAVRVGPPLQPKRRAWRARRSCRPRTPNHFDGALAGCW